MLYTSQNINVLNRDKLLILKFHSNGSHLQVLYLIAFSEFARIAIVSVCPFDFRTTIIADPKIGFVFLNTNSVTIPASNDKEMGSSLRLRNGVNKKWGQVYG